MGILQSELPPRDDMDRAERFYSKLRARVAAWLEKNANVSDQVKEYLLLLPDLFALLARLMADPRVDATLKLQLAVVGAYVISPLDFVPDFILPFGLMDDAVAVAFVLSRLTRIMGQAGEDILVEHWEGDGDVLAQIKKIAETADNVLSSRILGRLRHLVER